MSTLYLECAMGASGDMLTGALLDLLPDPAPFFEQMRALEPLGVRLSAEQVHSGGLRGRRVHVEIFGREEHAHEHTHGAHHHAHSSLGSIYAHIDAWTALPERVRADAKAVYAAIAQAEAKVHGQPVEHVHFHEVGALDALCDVTAVCLLVDLLGRPEIVASPVHVGSGTVRCAHGVLPVPAPATAELLLGIPCYGGSVEGELCTPTGAALLRCLATRFGPMPAMAAGRIGVGFGTKTFPDRPNCLRAFLGEAAETGEVVQLSCNLDDMTGEALAFAMEQLLEAGALDVLLLPATGKKGRPAQQLQCLCAPQDEQALAALIFRHTTTLGLRRQRLARYTLSRHIEQTPAGRIKHAAGFGTVHRKAEYEDAAQLARERGLSLAQASAEILRAGEEQTDV